MAENIWLDDFYCPQCGKQAERNDTILNRQYSTRALSLPFFSCGSCRVCSFDKRLIRQFISRWREDSPAAQAVPYNKIYQDVTRWLEEIMDYYVESAGYRLERFRLKKRRSGDGRERKR